MAKAITEMVGESCRSPPRTTRHRRLVPALGRGSAAHRQAVGQVDPPLCDSSINHHNGTYAWGGEIYQVAGVVYSSEPAVGADGSSGVIGTGVPTSGLTGDTSSTYEGWFKSTGTVQDQVS